MFSFFRSATQSPWGIVFLGILLAGCSKYAIPLSPPLPVDHSPDPVILIPEPFVSARDKVRKYLEGRLRLESSYSPPHLEAQEIRFNQPWIRGTSLDYYMLLFDQRKRHTVEWKAQWIVKARNPTLTEIRLEVLELIFMGPPYRAGVGPLLNQQWFETDSGTHRRALLELRRFWQTQYSSKELPTYLAHIPVPMLDFPPQGNEALKTSWTPLKRPRFGE